MTEKLQPQSRNLSWQSVPETGRHLRNDSLQQKVQHSPLIFEEDGESILIVDSQNEDNDDDQINFTTIETKKRLQDILHKINSCSEIKKNIKKFKPIIMKEESKTQENSPKPFERKKKVKFSISPVKITSPEKQQEFDELQYYRELFFRYGDELKQVFMGMDGTINPKTLARDIRRSKSNKHHYLIRNLRYIIKKSQFSQHNTDLDDLEDQNDKLAQLHRQLGVVNQNNMNEKEKKVFMPEKFQHVLQRSNSILSFFKNEDAISRSSNNQYKTLSDLSSKLSLTKQIKLKQQQIEMVYFDKNLNMTKKPPLEIKVEDNDISNPSQESLVKKSKEYTIKDLTQKNANIKKIFAELCPEKFTKKTKTFRYTSLQNGGGNNSLFTKTPYLGSTADNTMIKDLKISRDQSMMLNGQSDKKKPLQNSSSSINVIDQSKMPPIKSQFQKQKTINHQSQSIFISPAIIDHKIIETTGQDANNESIEQILQKREDDLKDLKKQAENLAKVPPPVIPKKPIITSKEDALSILYKFKDLHRYNIYNTRRKLDNINLHKQLDANDIEYENLYDKNKEFVVKQLDENKVKYQVKRVKKQAKIVDGQEDYIIKKSKSHQTLPEIEQHQIADYDQSGRLIIKNPNLAERLINNIMNHTPQSMTQLNSPDHMSLIKKKLPFVHEPVSFHKTKRQFFKTKKEPYISVIHEKTSQEKLTSFNQVLRNLKQDSDLQIEEKLLRRDKQLKDQETIVQQQMQGQPLFQDLEYLDKIDHENKYFKWQVKKFEKDPLYHVNYKRELAIMDAQIVRENAKRESKEMQELETKKIMEKRDMFMSRTHEKKKKKKIIHQKIQQKIQELSSL